MANVLQSVMNGRLGVGFAVACGRLLPPRLAERLIDFLANYFVQQRHLSIARAVHANQSAIAPSLLSAAALDQAVHDTFCYAGRFLYDLYRHQHNPAAIQSLVTYTPNAEALLSRMASGSPTIVVGPHLGNFDLAARAIVQRQPIKNQILSYPQPGDGYRWQNQMRERAGLHMTPASLSALRAARQTLQNGGTVGSGVDRPVSDHKYCPRFFGRPAPLPVLHITLALKTGAPIFVVGIILRPDGVYEVHASDAIFMEPFADRHTEIIANAEKTLCAAADLILLAPQQWMMFYPIWPEN